MGRALALALRASAPPALALTLAGLALGLLGRAAPSLQLVSLSLPARTLLGLALAMLGLATLAATLAAAWRGRSRGGEEWRSVRIWAVRRAWWSGRPIRDRSGEAAML